MDVRSTITERMLQLKDLAILRGEAENQTDWCRKIGLPKQNYRQLILGLQGFTHEQIHAAVYLVDASFDFVYGKIKTVNYPQKRVSRGKTA